MKGEGGFACSTSLSLFFFTFFVLFVCFPLLRCLRIQYYAVRIILLRGGVFFWSKGGVFGGGKGHVVRYVQVISVFLAFSFIFPIQLFVCVNNKRLRFIFI